MCQSRSTSSCKGTLRLTNKTLGCCKSTVRTHAEHVRARLVILVNSYSYNGSTASKTFMSARQIKKVLTL